MLRDAGAAVVGRPAGPDLDPTTFDAVAATGGRSGDHRDRAAIEAWAGRIASQVDTDRAAVGETRP